MAGAKDRWSKRWIDPKWRHNLTNTLMGAFAVAVFTTLAGTPASKSL
jgi:ABC-type spermidine/putrescine transport system permease subunit II